MSVNTFFQELFIKKKTDILRELEQNEQTNYTLRINTIISKDECASLGILNKIDETKSKIRDIFYQITKFSPKELFIDSVNIHADTQKDPLIQTQVLTFDKTLFYYPILLAQNGLTTVYRYYEPFSADLEITVSLDLRRKYKFIIW